MTRNSPCMTCGRRSFGCHTRCEDYTEWRKAKDKQNEERHFQAEVTHTLLTNKRNAQKSGSGDAARRRRT